jgi:hypothetical protein
VTGVDFNRMIREAAGRHDRELTQQPVEPVGRIGAGTGANSPWWPQRRDPGALFNEQVRNAVAVQRGLLAYRDLSN